MQDHARRPLEPLALDEALREEIHLVWDELADFGAVQAVQACARLMAFLCDRAGAWNAIWAGPIRFGGNYDDDPLQGWGVSAVQALHPIPPRPDEGHVKEILKAMERRELDPSFYLPLNGEGMGAFRTYSFRRELPEEWFSSPFYERHYGSVGTFDAAFVAFPINEDCESHFGFYARRRFTDAEIALLAYALRGIKWFHRNMLLSRGLLLASTPLTRVERRVLQLLLTDATEKQIARQAEMTPSTVHQYVVAIYRKFGVKSRAGLMSRWLSRLS